MEEVLLSILGAIAAVLILAVVRTLVIKAPAPGKCDTEITPEELDTAAQKLGAHGPAIGHDSGKFPGGHGVVGEIICPNYRNAGVGFAKNGAF